VKLSSIMDEKFSQIQQVRQVGSRTASQVTNILPWWKL